ncbi:hypothetical protein ACXZ1K_16855 [Pedobacter sp. PWIIR3]
MKSIKKMAYVISIFLLSSLACKKIKTQVSEPEPMVTVEPENKPNEPTKKTFVPVKFESATLTLDIKYQENTTFISEISISSGIKYTVAYANDLPKRMERFLNGVRNYAVDYLVTNGTVTRVNQFDVLTSRYQPLDKYQLEYNTDGKISVIKTYAVTNALAKTTNLLYGAEGNLISYSVEIPDKTSFTCNYDSNPGIFGAVKSAQLLEMELPYYFLTFGPHNLTKMSGGTKAENREYTYTYNKDSYPSELILKTESGTQTFKITYMEIK